MGIILQVRQYDDIPPAPRRDDLNAMHCIDDMCFKKDRRSLFQMQKDTEDSLIIFAFDDVKKEMVGFITGRPFIRDHEVCFYICYFDVLPKWQHKGIGSKLLEDIEDEATKVGIKEIFLHCSGKVAGFYEKAGYEKFDECAQTHGFFDEHLYAKRF